MGQRLTIGQGRGPRRSAPLTWRNVLRGRPGRFPLVHAALTRTNGDMRHALARCTSRRGMQRGRAVPPAVLSALHRFGRRMRSTIGRMLLWLPGTAVMVGVPANSYRRRWREQGDARRPVSTAPSAPIGWDSEPVALASTTRYAVPEPDDSWGTKGGTAWSAVCGHSALSVSHCNGSACRGGLILSPSSCSYSSSSG